MTLADRLAQAKQSKTPVATEDYATVGEPRREQRHVDPFADVKRSVHQTLLDALGPKLYDARMAQSELEGRVRATLQEVLQAEETPLSTADRARIAQEIADDILGYGPLEPYLRDPDVTEVMVNGPGSIYV
ncbi:MAG: hypothetical protein LC640_06530, partial [Frankia sp.]|nr:hypothetical protein [Frankia sp.]